MSLIYSQRPAGMHASRLSKYGNGSEYNMEMAYQCKYLLHKLKVVDARDYILLFLTLQVCNVI